MVYIDYEGIFEKFLYSSQLAAIIVKNQSHINSRRTRVTSKGTAQFFISCTSINRTSISCSSVKGVIIKSTGD